MQELRFDEHFLKEELKIKLLQDYCLQYDNKALTKRTELLIKTYEL